MWLSAICAFSIVFATAAVTALFPSGKKLRSTYRPIENFLLADQGLSKSSVVSLLLSSSFGLNALFYQVWLGYSVGAWGLVAQGAWALSFFLLAPFSNEIKKHKSLHDSIGDNFGKGVRILAGLCSIIGIMYLMGWEVAVGTSTMQGLFNENKLSSFGYAEILSGAIVAGCLLYTVLGGLKGNSLADKYLNLFKLVTLTLLTTFIFMSFIKSYNGNIISKFFPSISVMEKNLGWWGLVTNVIFSAAWQFVDNSTWQSVISGKEENKDTAAANLKFSGLVIFIAPGIIGTVLGISLNGFSGITQDNLLGKAFESISFIDSTILQVFMFVIIFSCIMSMIDGLFLASAFALIIDVFHPNDNFSELDDNVVKAEKLLVIIRVSLILFALIGIFGVQFLFKILDVSLFDFVYVVVITQLALIGPVLYSLMNIKLKATVGYVSICLSLLSGFLCVYLGSSTSNQWLIDGAGTFTVIISLTSVYIFEKIKML